MNLDMRRNLASLDSKVRSLEGKLWTLGNELYLVILTTTTIWSKFIVHQMKIADIASSWTRKKIHPDLFPLLNLSTEEFEMFSYELMTPMSCVHEHHSSNILIKLRAKKVSEHAIIAAADPFFFRKINEKEEVCRWRYQGPDFVVLNLTSHEFCPLDKKVEQVILSDSGLFLDRNSSKGLAWWNDLDCGNPTYNMAETFLQIKIFDHPIHPLPTENHYSQ